jgi:hypothetical protein
LLLRIAVVTPRRRHRLFRSGTADSPRAPTGFPGAGDARPTGPTPRRRRARPRRVEIDDLVIELLNIVERELEVGWRKPPPRVVMCDWRRRTIRRRLRARRRKGKCRRAACFMRG